MSFRMSASLTAAVLGLGTMTTASLISPAALAQGHTNSPNSYVDAGLAVVSAIDRYEMAAVWQSASSAMKNSVPEERFIGNIAQKRAQLGTIRSRDWMSVMKVPITVAEGGLPAGDYVSVRFATVGNNGKVMEEVISFRYDEDSQWRLVGYTLN